MFQNTDPPDQSTKTDRKNPIYHPSQPHKTSVIEQDETVLTIPSTHVAIYHAVRCIISEGVTPFRQAKCRQHSEQFQCDDVDAENGMSPVYFVRTVATAHHSNSINHAVEIDIILYEMRNAHLKR